MVWGAFTNFNKNPLVIMPQGEKNAIDFIHNVYNNTLNGYYFMLNQPHEPTLIEDGTPIH